METLWNAAQNGFAALGLNTPASRFGAVFMASSLAEYLIQPGYAYGDGGMRAPVFLDGEFGTLVPAFVVPFLLATASATFV